MLWNTSSWKRTSLLRLLRLFHKITTGVQIIERLGVYVPIEIMLLMRFCEQVKKFKNASSYLFLSWSAWTFKNTSLAIQEEGINSAKVAYKTVQISIFWKKNIKDHLHIVLLLSGIQRSNQNELYKFTGVTLYSVETEMQSSY